MKIHDLSAQHIFPRKRYTTYECISELVVTVPSARSTIVKPFHDRGHPAVGNKQHVSNAAKNSTDAVTFDQQVEGANPSCPAVECNPGQVVNTLVPLSSISIIWYQPMGGDALRLGR